MHLGVMKSYLVLQMANLLEVMPCRNPSADVTIWERYLESISRIMGPAIVGWTCIVYRCPVSDLNSFC